MRIGWAIGLVFLSFGCQRNTPARAPSELATSSEPARSELVVGSVAPDFTAVAHDGTTIHVAAMKGRPVVLYFYPKDETPGCTKEACAFRDAWKDLEAAGVVLVGISADSIDSHRSFAKHHELPFHLVSDADGAIARAYGVPNRYVSAKGVQTDLLSRQSIVIGPDGNVKKIYRSVDITKHAAEVLSDVTS